MLTPSNLLVQQLKVLADLTRMRLIALCRHGECSVSELTEVTGQSQPRISQQLRALCEADLLSRSHVNARLRSRRSIAPDSMDVPCEYLRLGDSVGLNLPVSGIPEPFCYVITGDEHRDRRD